MDCQKKIFGCIAGAAIGDAMGAATETRTMDMIYRDFNGWVTSIVPPPDDCFARGRPAGTVTDDFSLAYFTAWELAKSGGRVSEAAAKKVLLDWADHSNFYVFAGPTTRAAIDRLRGIDVPDPEAYLACNNHRATNGAAMKIFGAGLINPGDLDKTIYDTFTLCAPTHPYNAALSGACAVSCAVSKAMEENADLGDVFHAGLYGAKKGYSLATEQGLLCAAPSIEKRILLAVDIAQRGLGWEKTMRELAEVVGSGLSAAESIPTVFGILEATSGDPMGAITMGVNIGNDTDTIATMAGAVAGTLNGMDSLRYEDISLIEQVNQMDLMGLSTQIWEAYYS